MSFGNYSTSTFGAFMSPPNMSRGVDNRSMTSLPGAGAMNFPSIPSTTGGATPPTPVTNPYQAGFGGFGGFGGAVNIPAQDPSHLVNVLRQDPERVGLPPAPVPTVAPQPPSPPPVVAPPPVAAPPPTVAAPPQGAADWQSMIAANMQAVPQPTTTITAPPPQTSARFTAPTPPVAPPPPSVVAPPSGGYSGYGGVGTVVATPPPPVVPAPSGVPGAGDLLAGFRQEAGVAPGGAAVVNGNVAAQPIVPPSGAGLAAPVIPNFAALSSTAAPGGYMANVPGTAEAVPAAQQAAAELAATHQLSNVMLNTNLQQVQGGGQPILNAGNVNTIHAIQNAEAQGIPLASIGITPEIETAILAGDVGATQAALSPPPPQPPTNTADSFVDPWTGVEVEMPDPNAPWHSFLPPELVPPVDYSSEGLFRWENPPAEGPGGGWVGGPEIPDPTPDTTTDPTPQPQPEPEPPVVAPPPLPEPEPEPPSKIFPHPGGVAPSPRLIKYRPGEEPTSQRKPAAGGGLTGGRFGGGGFFSQIQNSYGSFGR